MVENKNRSIEFDRNLEIHDLLHNYISEGFVLAKMVFDKKGQPTDCRILETNFFNIIHKGLKREQAPDQRVKDFLFAIEPLWLEKCSDVVRSDKFIKFEKFYDAPDRWFEVQISSLYKDNQFIIMIKDISEPLTAQKALKVSEAEYLNKLKVTEKALRKSEEKYRTLFNSMGESLCVLEMMFNSEGKPVDARFIEINPAYKKQSAWNVVEGELLSKYLKERDYLWLEVLSKVALTGEPAQLTNKIESLNRWYEVTVFKIEGPDSRKVAVFFNNITERKQTEDKLNFQANLLASVHDAIVATNGHYLITYWNEMAEKMFGWSAQEVLGKSAQEVLQTVVPNAFQEAQSKLIEEGCFIGEIISQRKDGTIFCTDTHWKVVKDQQGNFIGSIATCRDITQRKQEEKELKAVKDGLAAEVEGLAKLHRLSTRFILQDNLQSTYEEILDAAIALTHADQGHIAILNKHSGYVEILAQRSLTGYEEDFLKNIHVQSGRSVTSVALQSLQRVIIEDASQSPIFVGTPGLKIVLDAGIKTIQSTPMISSSGISVGTLTTMYRTPHVFEERELRLLDLLARQAADAIERLRAEETIHRSEKRALSLVEELRKMDDNKNAFLSTMSHELRNPLASIMMSLSLLDQGIFGGEQAQQAKEIMNRQVTQLSRLVDDLLDVTRITQNKISLKRESVNLNELISKAVEDYNGLFASQQVRMDIELTSTPLYLEADPARLTQVIGNLLHNAAKFTQKGDTIEVTVWKDEDQQEAVLCIKDNGLGIRPDVLPDLFLPFIQADSSLDRSRGGLGLGLAIVKGMVELHGGSVTAASEGLRKGAQFTIRLPLPAALNKPQSHYQEDRERISRTFRILVIDDIPDVAEILCALLRNLGHEVISAHNGSEGITIAKAFHPDVLFCDIGMPGMNGYEVAERFRRDQELKDIFLIALTGYAQSSDLERAREAGFNRHLAKPVNLSTLEHTLSEVT